MEDPPPQKQTEKKQRKKNKAKNTTNGENNSKEAVETKIFRRKVKKTKEKGKDKKIISRNNNSDVFVFDEIASNKDASALIYDLVNCYTHKCGLPRNELDSLNKTLFEKTISVFLIILNNCVEKIYNKLLKSDYLVGKKVATKDAFCQTDISYEN